MCSDTVISAINLTKIYRMFGHPGDRIKQAITLGRIKFHQEFTALEDVSFEIKRGESIGVIGHNGSGKSTLLQLICGILKATSGTVEVNGRMSALLELGAGFNSEFTGRENVYLQGAIQGFRREDIESRFDDIAAFADIGKYIDQPVRTYSSGMYVRLAFSVAISANPDILVVDEALSVGDVVFQHKSKKRVRKLTESGTTLIVVSHDRNTINAMCSRSILLDKGKMLMDGLPSEAFDYYYAVAAAKSAEAVSRKQLDSGQIQIVSGTGEAKVLNIRLLDKKGSEVNLIEVGTAVVLEFEVHVYVPIPRLVFGFTIRDHFGQALFGTNTNSFGKSLDNVLAGSRYKYKFGFNANIGDGSYSVSTALVSTDDRFTNNFECRELAYFFEVQNLSHPKFGGGIWLNPILEIESQ